jgi:hypothetical protein
MNTPAFDQLPDRELLLETRRLASGERQAAAQLIAALAELDARRLYLGEGCSSLFTYCTQVLHLSEHAAYGRIGAARTGHRFPLILKLLADGSINVTTVTLLAAHLTSENHRAVLEEARHKSKREIEHIVARLRPQPDLPSSVRKLPAPRSRVSVAVEGEGKNPRDEPPIPIPTVAAASTRPAVVAPLAPERFKIQFTVGRETYEKLRRAQDLLRHRIPTGDAAEVFDRALTVLLERLEKEKIASTNRSCGSRSQTRNSRHIPASVKRAVWARDDGRCAFVGREGRCTEQGFLEFHHVVPYAAGGEAGVENIELRCRSHNAYESEQFFRFDIVREASIGYKDSSNTVAGRYRRIATAPARTPDVADYSGRRRQPATGPSMEVGGATRSGPSCWFERLRLRGTTLATAGIVQ